MKSTTFRVNNAYLFGVRAKIRDTAQSLTTDLTFARPDNFFYYQITHLGLQKLKPAKLMIGGHRFGVTSFSWQQPWGFSTSCKNEHPRLETLEEFAAAQEAISCGMKFIDLSVQFGCYLKAMSFDEQSIKLSFGGSGVICEKHVRPNSL